LIDPVRLIGRTLGDFIVERLLGRGGMGEVYLARQISLPRNVALKILKPELAQDQQYLKRFTAEAKSLAPIHHPNIVSVHAIGQESGLHYIALEYVRGIDLRRFIEQKGALEESVALRIARLVAAALVRAAEAGIVHRDIKPENVLLTRQGEVKVADFGLARTAAQEDVRLTQTGITMGTPLYMSPEQIQGQPIDARSDLYSLGIVCYQMLAGEPPFRGQTAMSVAIQHVHGTPEPLGEIRPDVRPEFLRLVGRLMAKTPADRYQSALDVLRDLEKLSRGDELLFPAGGGIDLAGSARVNRPRSLWSRSLHSLRHLWGYLTRPPARPWFAAGSMLVALVGGGMVVSGVRQTAEVPLRIANVFDVPVQENGFMQLSYANTLRDPVDRERALWAVLIRHRGDDTFPLLAARQLADVYLAGERVGDLHLLSRFLGDREDLTMRTLGRLLQAVGFAAEGEFEQSDRALEETLALGERKQWAAGETVDWLARHFFLTDRLVSGALQRSPPLSVARRDRFWKAFLPPDRGKQPAASPPASSGP
jgi:serine/threonine protein kinase